METVKKQADNRLLPKNRYFAIMASSTDNRSNTIMVRYEALLDQYDMWNVVEWVDGVGKTIDFFTDRRVAEAACADYALVYAFDTEEL